MSWRSRIESFWPYQIYNAKLLMVGIVYLGLPMIRVVNASVSVWVHGRLETEAVKGKVEPDLDSELVSWL